METTTKTAAAPSAAAGNPPTNLADFAELARQSIADAPTPAAKVEQAKTAAATAKAEAAATETTETPAAGQESPPANEETPAADATAAAATTTETTEEPAEPTADEQAAWTDSERRIYGALSKERAESKTARAETRALREELNALKTKLQTPSESGKPATGQPANGATPATAAAPSATTLNECNTFAAVDQQVNEAAATEATVVRVQNILTRNGLEAAAKELNKIGITKIQGVPLAELDTTVVGDFLDSAYAGTRAVQAAGPQRKEFLSAREQSWNRVAQAAPEINDPQSPLYKQVEQVLRGAPELKHRADGPEIAVKLAMGNAAFNAKAKPAPAATAKPAATKPAVKPAPGAPTRAAGAAATPDARATLQKKINDGTASLAEVQQLTRMDVAAE